MDKLEKIRLVRAVREGLASGLSLRGACARCGVSAASYLRWAERFDAAGLEGLETLPRTGRPPMVRLSEAEAHYLRSLYLRSNLTRDAGSMTLCARMAAKDPESPLSEAVREAILAPRCSKHALPVEVRRALRASTAEVRRYRDPKAGRNDGVYAPDTIRMVDDGQGGLRRLLPGERQVWDDASVNVGVVVPWPRGGDKCADKWGVRVARFQLLLGIDCATDMCVGYHYVMRQSDAYGAADVVQAFDTTWRLAGGMPRELVLEGGAWQASRTRDYLAAAGVKIVSAKGRPNQKLVEGYFNRLWTCLSVTLPPQGQVGRFRGEMAAENADWRRAREGVIDPRTVFPELTVFLEALDRAIAYLNSEQIESRAYGRWVPSEAYAGAQLQPLVSGLEAYALPVREKRTVRRQGLVAIRTTSPLGWPHTYTFAIRGGWMWDGAEVEVAFNPAEAHRGAYVTLAKAFHDTSAGVLLDEHAELLNAAPMLTRGVMGGWRIAEDCRIGEAKAAKKQTLAAVAAQTAAFDTRGVKARKGQDERKSVERRRGILTGEAPAPFIPAETPELRLPARDLDAEEAALGIYTA